MVPRLLTGSQKSTFSSSCGHRASAFLQFLLQSELLPTSKKGQCWAVPRNHLGALPCAGGERSLPPRPEGGSWEHGAGHLQAPPLQKRHPDACCYLPGCKFLLRPLLPEGLRAALSLLLSHSLNFFSICKSL